MVNNVKHLNFIINGAARSGKDTFIDLFKRNAHGIIINNISTVDYIKTIAVSAFGWDGVKDEKGRRLLSDLKDADTRYREGPLKRIIFQIDCIKYNNTNKTVANFIHSREPEEIQKFKESLENCQTILVERKNIESFMNHADQNVKNYNYDIIVNNYGTLEDLENVVKYLVDQLGILK
jgi:hypothetical protein